MALLTHANREITKETKSEKTFISKNQLFDLRHETKNELITSLCCSTEVHS